MSKRIYCCKCCRYIGNKYGLEDKEFDKNHFKIDPYPRNTENLTGERYGKYLCDFCADQYKKHQNWKGTNHDFEEDSKVKKIFTENIKSPIYRMKEKIQDTEFEDYIEELLDRGVNLSQSISSTSLTVNGETEKVSLDTFMIDDLPTMEFGKAVVNGEAKYFMQPKYYCTETSFDFIKEDVEDYLLRNYGNI